MFFKLFSSRTAFVKKKVFCLKAKCPEVNYKPKASNQMGIVFKKMMFGFQLHIWKDFFEKCPMFKELCFQVTAAFTCESGRCQYFHNVFNFQNQRPGIIFRDFITNNNRQQSEQSPVFMAISSYCSGQVEIYRNSLRIVGFVRELLRDILCGSI